MNSTLKQSALGYARMGYSVIPLRPRDKRPMVDFMWAEYQKRPATEKEISEWWDKEPNANIGIITGQISGIVVIDVDVDKGGSYEFIAKALPTGQISQTGSGGYHFIYDYPYGTTDKIHNRVTTGVDIRGDGGYIVAPPSIHSNGKAYQWIESGQRAIFDPKSLQEILPTYSNEDNLGEHWISDLMTHGIKAGGRNNACAKLAGYYIGKGIPVDIVVSMMQEWNRKNSPPLSQAEIEATVQSVNRTYLYNEKHKVKSPVKTEQEAEEGFDLMDIGHYMSKFGETKVSWLIDDWLPDETIAFLVAPPGSYKTWVTLDLAVSIASGKPFLGEFEVNKTGPVIVIQQEDFHGGLAERTATIINEKYNLIGDSVTLPPDLPIYFHTERRLRFHDDEVMADFMAQVERINPVLVIIDPLYSTTSTDDYMAKTAELMFPLKALRDKTGCSFVLAHHTKKSVEGSNMREGLWGSQFLNAFLETGWQIRKTDSPNVITLLRHFKLRGAMDQVRLDFDISTEKPYKYKVKIDDDTDMATVDIVGVLQTSGPMNITEISQKTGIHRSTVSRRLKLMVKDGILFKDQHDKYNTIDSISAF